MGSRKKVKDKEKGVPKDAFEGSPFPGKNVNHIGARSHHAETDIERKPNATVYRRKT
ncbi:MAG: hypothetical protein QG650_400 [Patescibacteria group bacterium]|nr:hypothetical protein [Patescibacteria group bacterium]